MNITITLSKKTRKRNQFFTTLPPISNYDIIFRPIGFPGELQVSDI